MSMLAEIRCPLVLAGAGPRTEAQTQLIVCYLVGYHKFKPKSQYNTSVQCTLFCGISMESNNRSVLSL